MKTGDRGGGNGTWVPPPAITAAAWTLLFLGLAAGSEAALRVNGSIRHSRVDSRVHSVQDLRDTNRQRLPPRGRTYAPTVRALREQHVDQLSSFGVRHSGSVRHHASGRVVPRPPAGPGVGRGSGGTVRRESSAARTGVPGMNLQLRRDMIDDTLGRRQELVGDTVQKRRGFIEDVYGPEASRLRYDRVVGSDGERAAPLPAEGTAAGGQWQELTPEERRRVRRAVYRVGDRVQEVPRGCEKIYVNNNWYCYSSGYYYQSYGDDDDFVYEVVAPPMGATVSGIQDDCNHFVLRGDDYYLCGDVYYRKSVYEDEVLYVVVEAPNR